MFNSRKSFGRKTMDSSDKPSSAVILLDCSNLIEKEQSKFSWKLTRNSKGLSPVVKTFTAKNVKPLKDGHSAFEMGHPDITDAPTLKPKKKKSPPTVAKDCARRQNFGNRINLPSSNKQRRILFLKRKYPFGQNWTVLCEEVKCVDGDLEHTNPVVNELDERQPLERSVALNLEKELSGSESDSDDNSPDYGVNCNIQEEKPGRTGCRLWLSSCWLGSS